MFDGLLKQQTKTKRSKRIVAADMWCGGGGTSTGMVQAAKKLGCELHLTAVNHWEIAVATHSKNHPTARHFCKAVDSINPLDIYANERLQLLVASPECVHHSRARGGKPRSEQKRADAWDLQRWVEKLYIETILLENIGEFTEWGPLKADGTPDKRHKGKYFKQFITWLEILYKVEWRILNCADYGDATSRKRFFLIAKRGKNKRIVFPAPTHASRKELEKVRLQPDLFDNRTAQLDEWRAAREIIDWSVPGKSIFNRKKPLSPNTMKRIYAGLRKYSGIDIPEREIIKLKEPIVTLTLTPEDREPICFSFPSRQLRETEQFVRQQEADALFAKKRIKVDASKLKPFVLPNEGIHRGNAARSVLEPLPTITSRGGGAVVTPFVMGTGGPTGQMQPRAVTEPLRTILTDTRQNLFTPYLINLKSSDRRMRSIDEPCFTQCSANHQMLVEPLIVDLAHTQNNNAAMCAGVEEPLKTVCGKALIGVVESYFISFHSGKKDGGINRSYDLADPLPTLDTSNRFGVVESFIVPCNHGKNDDRAYSLDDPLKTITGVDAWGFVTPFLVKFNHHQGAQDVNEPLGTLTTKDRYGLCIPELGAILDITFRMLLPSELARATSFPEDYYFAGNREQQVKQIGNAVPVKTAEALITAILEN